MSDPLDDLDAPPIDDFRRIGRGIPLVMNDDSHKWMRYARFSNSGKILDDEAGLTDWRIRVTTFGASQRPDLMAAASVLDPNTDKKELRDVAEECLVAGKGRMRQIIGTSVHRMLDHVDLGHDWIPSPTYQAAVEAYIAARDAYGLVVVDVECHCVNDQLRMAGTMDRRYRTTRNLIAPDMTMIPIGAVLVADTKTGRELEYAAGSYSTQIAGYVDALRYDVHTNERSQFDPPSYREWALIFHVVVDDGRCDVYWIDCNAGREGLQLAQQVKAWRKRTDLVVPSKPPTLALVPAIDPEGPPDPPQGDLTDETTPGLRQWLRERVEAIKGTPAALDALLRKWPLGVPGLKHEGHTPDQLASIEALLDWIESEWSLPFPGRDPRVIDGGRPSAVHPRQAVFDSWMHRAEIHQHDTGNPLALALRNFAWLDGEYTDLELSELLDGTIRGLGYPEGLDELTGFQPTDVDLLHHAISLITTEAFALRYIDGRPVVLAINLDKGKDDAP